MATVTSAFKVKGSIGSMVISGTQRGGQRAYLKGRSTKAKFYKSKRYNLCRKNAQEFGGAAMCGSAIYMAAAIAMTSHTRREDALFAPYSHNYLAKRLRRHADRTNGYCAHYHYAAAIPALQGLDLSPEGSPSKQVSIQPLGPHHAPTHLRIQGLRNAAEVIHVSGQTRLECRIKISHAAFPELTFDAEDFKWTCQNDINGCQPTETMWFPVDIIPAEGIKIALPTQEFTTTQLGNDQPILHFVLVQWRTQQGKKKPKHLRGHNIIRYAAATIQEATLEKLKTQSPWAFHSVHRKNQKRYNPTATSYLLPATSKPALNSELITLNPKRPLKEALPHIYLKWALKGDPTQQATHHPTE